MRAAAVGAAPITPTRDDEVIEVLPASAGNRGEDRQLAQAPGGTAGRREACDGVSRDAISSRRASPEIRASRAGAAALRAWPDANAAPDDVLLLRATLEQYLHEFDAAVAHLRVLLAGPAASGRRRPG
jgi:hypothetical protein